MPGLLFVAKRQLAMHHGSWHTASRRCCQHSCKLDLGIGYSITSQDKMEKSRHSSDASWECRQIQSKGKMKKCHRLSGGIPCQTPRQIWSKHLAELWQRRETHTLMHTMRFHIKIRLPCCTVISADIYLTSSCEHWRVCDKPERSEGGFVNGLWLLRQVPSQMVQSVHEPRQGLNLSQVIRDTV